MHKKGFIISMIAIIIFFGVLFGTQTDLLDDIKIDKKSSQKIEEDKKPSNAVDDTEKSKKELEKKEIVKEPTDRALRAAISSYNDMSKSRQAEMIEKFGGGSENYRDTVREMALYLDRNRTNLVELEMDLEKTNQVQNSSGGYQPTIQPPVQNTGPSQMDQYMAKQDQDCQKRMGEYNTCIAEYNTKMSEYNTCLHETSNPSSYKYANDFLCHKPFNFCHKPFC